MATRDERLQKIWRGYDARLDHKPSSAREAVRWAVAEGLLELPEIDPHDVLAEQMSDALRNEYATDDHGRRYRVNHAVRVTKGGVQLTFWGKMGFASHDHMEKAFGQRREQIVGDNLQLKTDVDVYNSLNHGKNPTIQLGLNYTEDVEERQEAQKVARKRVEAVA